MPSTARQPSNWLDDLTAALPKISAFVTAEQLAQINIERAKKGMPALNTSTYGPQVGVSLDPKMQKMIMYAALGLGGLVVLKLLKRRAG
jgi:hypothetical protein